MPAMRNDSQTAAPATSPAAPRRAKMPAPTMAPTPIKAACRMLRCFGRSDWSGCPAIVASCVSGSAVGRYGCRFGHVAAVCQVDVDAQQERAAGHDERSPVDPPVGGEPARALVDIAGVTRVPDEQQ